MAGIEDTRLERLAPAERTEIEEILAEARGVRFGTSRFVSDEGDVFVWYLFLVVCAMGAIVAILVEGTEGVRVIGGVEQDFIAYLALAFIVVWVAWTFDRVHGRHGWMASSFAVMRIRGSRVRLLRYGDVTRLARRKGRGYTRVVLEAAGGRRLGCYAGNLVNTIKPMLPSSATVSED